MEEDSNLVENIQIKQELRDHLIKTEKKVKSLDGWDLVNIPDISERELLKIANRHGLENDEQTRNFCKFISIGSNFASLDFKDRLQRIPDLVAGIKDLLNKIEEEIKEFAEIANVFQNLIHSFVKIVMNTKNKMNMALPHLEESTVYMSVMKDALMPDSDKPLSPDDMLDVDIALTNLASGIVNLIDLAKQSKEESVQLETKISKLREKVDGKITVTKNRIGFSKLMPKMGAALGLTAGAGAVGTAVEISAFGGAGALVLGGLSFPPLGAILIGAVLGAFSIGSIIFLIMKLWEKHQFKALEYLRLILEKLNALNSANIAFMNYMNKSEEDASRIVTNLNFLKMSVKSGSKRFRKASSEMCGKAIDSTHNMIQCIEKINKIDIDQWISGTNMPKYTIMECETTKL